MKQILFYTDTTQIGGAEHQIFLLAKFLDKQRFTPVLACSSAESLDKWCRKFTAEKIQVIRLKAKHKHSPFHYFELKKIVKAENIDLIHAHVWNPASCRYVFLLKGIPIITTEHDPFKLSRIKNIFKKYSLKKIKKIITVSNNNKQVLEGLFPDHKNKISVIHNGIDVDWWQSQLLRLAEEDYSNIKKNLFYANKNTLIISTIAELHERKGIKYLIEAMKKITEVFPNVKLVVIGEGDERRNLEDLIEKLALQKHVVLMGRQQEVPKLLKSSDIFCLPSKREAFGLVNAEAMITRLPVVASAVGGIPEIVQDGVTGILVPPENSGKLAEALVEVIGDPKKRFEMGVKGFELVLKKFNAKLMAKEYEKMYETI
jgi:glycosyltransferase involved in cell wall biosynthesis